MALVRLHALALLEVPQPQSVVKRGSKDELAIGRELGERPVRGAPQRSDTLPSPRETQVAHIHWRVVLFDEGRPVDELTIL